MGNKRLTKLERLVNYLKQSATLGRQVTRNTITKRFRHDPSFVVYFNGLRRNGAVNSKTNLVTVSKIGKAITTFRRENREKQIAHYARKGLAGSAIYI